MATPTRVEGLSEIEDVRAGDGHTCARSRDDQVWCWGDNSANQISDTAPDLIESPLMLSGVDFVDVRGDSTCVREGGFVICSGANTANFNASPILEIETTDTAACAIGVVDFHCAGTHLDPATGNTMTTTTATRYQIDGGAFLNEVAIGPNHACAATADGVLRCWGDNSSGQLGVPSATLSRGVATVDLAGVTTVDVGLRHTCARTVQGEVHCFGSGTFGQLGDGMMRDQSSPVEALELR